MGLSVTLNQNIYAAPYATLAAVYTAPTLLIVETGRPACNANNCSNIVFPLLSCTTSQALSTYHTCGKEREMSNRVLMRCFVALNHVEGTLGELTFSDGLLAVLGDIVTR